jgi:hypothetical protein
MHLNKGRNNCYNRRTKYQSTRNLIFDITLYHYNVYIYVYIIITIKDRSSHKIGFFFCAIN